METFYKRRVSPTFAGARGCRRLFAVHRKAQDLAKNLATFSLLLILEGVNIAAESGFNFFNFETNTVDIEILWKKSKKCSPTTPIQATTNKICAEKRSCGCESEV